MSNVNSDEDLFAQLEDVFQNVDDEEIVPYDEWDLWDLGARLAEINARLKELGEVLQLGDNSTQEGRELHSQRYAINQAIYKKQHGG